MSLKSLALVPLLCALVLTASAEDPRERAYQTPPVQPTHQPKPKVTGWAATRVSEPLNRGLLAMPAAGGKVFLSWRLLKTDATDMGFNLYRQAGSAAPERLNAAPITATTDFLDVHPAAGEAAYWVRPVAGGKELAPSEKVSLKPGASAAPLYRTIKFQGNYTTQRIAAADLNGDGAYDFVVKQPGFSIDPGVHPDSPTDVTYKLEAYLSDGTFLWRKDLGHGIEPGIWYSPYVVYDFDGDGKAEVAVKTAPDDSPRDATGRITGGAETVSILDGMTGQEITRADWPPRDARYGDYNRLNRNQMGVAYLDGKTPCLLVARGTYKLMVLDAYEYHDKKLKKLWHWEGDDEQPVIRSQGSHQMQIADIDGDGRDEVVLGSCAIDDDGTCLWSAGLGHPDKVYVTDIDPTRPGLEVFFGVEAWHTDGSGVCIADARTGKFIWTLGKPTRHVGDGMVADLDPSIPGLECWAQEDPKGGSTAKYMLSAAGKPLGTEDDVPACRSWIFWDGDLLRETISGGGFGFGGFRGFGRMRGRRDARATSGTLATNRRPGGGFFSAGPDGARRPGGFTPMPGSGASIVKYKGDTITSGVQGAVAMIADLAGDWREEIVTVLPGELRVYSTPLPARDRRVTLMQDPIYRAAVTERSNGYEQSPVPGYYLGIPPEEASKAAPVISKAVKPIQNRDGFQQ